MIIIACFSGVLVRFYFCTFIIWSCYSSYSVIMDNSSRGLGTLSRPALKIEELYLTGFAVLTQKDRQITQL